MSRIILIIWRPHILFEIVIVLLFSKLHRYRSGNFHEMDENKTKTENKSGKLMIGKCYYCDKI